LTDGFRVEVEIQLDEFHRLEREGIPCLPAEQVTQNGFEVKFVGEFKDKDPAWLQNVPDLRQCLGGVCHVVQHADHRGGVKQTLTESQAIDICRDVDVFFRASHTLLGLG